MTIGNRIQILRKEKGLSQNQLAKLTGTSRQAVSKWENDQTTPDTLHLIQLADLLTVDVEYLATGRPAEKTDEQLNEKKPDNHTLSSASSKIASSDSFFCSPLFVILISVLAFLLGMILSFLLILLS